MFTKDHLKKVNLVDLEDLQLKMEKQYMKENFMKVAMMVKEDYGIILK